MAEGRRCPHTGRVAVGTRSKVVFAAGAVAGGAACRTGMVQLDRSPVAGRVALLALRLDALMQGTRESDDKQEHAEE